MNNSRFDWLHRRAPSRQNSQKIPWIFSLFTNKNPLATSDKMSYNTPISYNTRLIFIMWKGEIRYDKAVENHRCDP